MVFKWYMEQKKLELGSDSKNSLTSLFKDGVRGADLKRKNKENLLQWGLTNVFAVVLVVSKLPLLVLIVL